MKLKALVIVLILSLLVIPTTMAQSECSNSGTLEEFETTFLNDTRTDVTVHWIDNECVEQEGTPLAAGEEYTFTTYDGHEFVFRNADGDVLMNYMVNTLLADETLELNQAIAEGAFASAFGDINERREELGFEPIYFSDALYNIAREAAEQYEEDAAEEGIVISDITDGADLNVTEVVFELAEEAEAGVQTAAAGIRDELTPVEDLAEIISSDFEDINAEYESNGEARAWLGEDIQSVAVYADENLFIYVFSTISQPELDAAWEARQEAAEGESADAPAIASNETVAGFLESDSEMNYYSLEAEAGVMYALHLTSTEFDPYLNLYNPSNEEIATNDDGGGDLNSFIAFTATEDGVYTVGLDSFVDGAEGNYTLSIAELSNEITGSVSSDSAVSTTTWDVEEGVTYVVSVSSEAFDTTLSVLDETGAEVVSNDDFEGTNSFVWFTAQSTGTYSVNVSSFDGAGAGDFRVLTGSFAVAEG